MQTIEIALTGSSALAWAQIEQIDLWLQNNIDSDLDINTCPFAENKFINNRLVDNSSSSLQLRVTAASKCAEAKQERCYEGDTWAIYVYHTWDYSIGGDCAARHYMLVNIDDDYAALAFKLVAPWEAV
jgi:hypothetical protein